jgi:DNA mismatch repair protein MutS
MSFHSILFIESDEATARSQEVPAFFADLNLDQIVEAVTADWKEYNLAALFYSPLKDVDSIAYRQEVMRDIDKPAVREAIRHFSGRMQEMRKCLTKAKELSEFKYALERWFLCAVEVYIGAIRHLSQALDSDQITSRGLMAFHAHLAAYSKSVGFEQLASEAEQCESGLSSFRYCVLLADGGVTVSRYDGEADYSGAVEDTFSKFRPVDAIEHQTPRRYVREMNHVQARVLEGLAQLYPEILHALSLFSSAHPQYLDEAVVRFDREVQFYIAYLTFIEIFRHADLQFSLPQISQTSKEIRCQNGFDLALAHKLIDRRERVVTNSFHLNGAERILVVSGPNQGGKTTFARMIAQMHYLGSLGCPVPGTEVCLFAFDQLFTHFERHEDIRDLRGKLQDDLVRIRHILDCATPASLIVVNEMFSSTTIKDAVYLSTKVMDRISKLDALAVWVTFLDELASLNEKTVSMVSTVDPANPAVRTYKIEQQAADGLAYALAIALKYRVTFDCLRERIKA